MCDRLSLFFKKIEFYPINIATNVFLFLIGFSLLVDVLIYGDTNRTIMSIFLGVTALIYTFHLSYERIFLGDALIIDKIILRDKSVIFNIKNIGCNPIYAANVKINSLNDLHIKAETCVNLLGPGESEEYSIDCSGLSINQASSVDYVVTMRKFCVFCQFFIESSLVLKDNVYAFSRTECKSSSRIFIRFPIAVQALILITFVVFLIDRYSMMRKFIENIPVVI